MHISLAQFRETRIVQNIQILMELFNFISNFLRCSLFPVHTINKVQIELLLLVCTVGNGTGDHFSFCTTVLYDSKVTFAFCMNLKYVGGIN